MYLVLVKEENISCRV